MKRKLPKHFTPVAVAVGLLLVALIGFLAVVKPQQTKADKLSTQIESVRLEITQNRLLSRQNVHQVAVKLADVFRLSKAMPDRVDMPGILLELNRVAGQSGIVFESITPQAEVAVSGYQMVPVEVRFTGNYYELSDFLYRLRNLVEVHRGELATAGRLFTVDAVHFAEGPKHFPQLEATMTVNAFVYGLPPVVPTDTTVAPTGETTGTTTGETTTGSTTTTPAPTTPTTPAAPAPPAGASAAGVNP